MATSATLRTSPSDLAARLRGPAIRRAIGRELNVIGADAVKYAKDNFLSGGPTATRTAVRSGQRRAAYAHQVNDKGSHWELDYGPIRSSGGEVPVHVRVLEGFNAAGQQVNQFVIRPRRGKYLTFPIRNGGGLAKGNVIGWRRVKQVILKPRPTFPAVKARVLGKIPDGIARAFEAVFR